MADFFVLLTRKSDRERFVYRFTSAAAAGDFQRRNRAPMPGGIPSPYGVSEILFRHPEGRTDYAGTVR
jgi:hypothetical protein